MNLFNDSRELIDIAMESAHVSTWEFDVEKKCAILPQAAQKQHGLGRIIEDFPESLIASGFIHADSAEKFREIFICEVEDNKSKQCDVYVQTPDRTDYWWERYVVTPVFDHHGKHIKSVVTGIDITEQKKIELQYKKQLNDIDNADDPNLLAKGRYNLTKNRLEWYLRNNEDGVYHTEDSTYDEGLYDVAKIAIMDSQKEELLNKLSRIQLLHEYHEGNKTFTVEYQRKAQSKAVIWVRLQCKVYAEPDTGDVICFIYSYDITASKTIASMINKVVDLDYDYLALLDCRDGEYTLYANTKDDKSPLPPFHTTEYEDEVERYARKWLVSEDIEQNIHDMSIDNLQEQLRDEDVFVSFCSIRTEDDRILRKKLKFSYLDRVSKQILITRVDITDIYEKEQAQMKKLQSANDAKTQFLSRMSHDLRTPMNAIIGLTALAKDEITNPQAMDEYLDKISSAGQFLLVLVNDCLDIEKISSNRMELHPSHYSYVEFKNSITTMIEPLCRQKNIQFMFGVDVKARDIIVDRVRFEQVFFNLLTNAVKFTPSGGKVELLIENTDTTYQDNRLICDFIVRDNGIGMSEEFQQRMYEPFVQENNSIETQSQGTGLGLAIVKNIVELMGGVISVKSTKGMGTEFIIHMSLPLAHECNNYKEQDGVDTSNECLSGKRVLLVEDHPLNIEIAKKILEKKGICVSCARNGQEAFDCFWSSELNYYHAILMDIRMPVMTGLEASMKIRQLERKDSKTIPIIAMTANVFEEDIRDTLDAGMDAHLSKPIEPEKLYTVLEKFIGNNQ